MSKWTKEELENMLEDVVNELELSDSAVGKHGQLGTAPAELVRLVLDEKDLRIRALEANFVDASKSNCNIQRVSNQRELLIGALSKFYDLEILTKIEITEIERRINNANL